MSAIGGPTAMMIDIAQVQPGFELQSFVPATTLVMFTLGGFGLRNEIKETAKDLSADIKDLSADIKDISKEVNENLERCACLSTHVLHLKSLSF